MSEHSDRIFLYQRYVSLFLPFSFLFNCSDSVPLLYLFLSLYFLSSCPYLLSFCSFTFADWSTVFARDIHVMSCCVTCTTVTSVTSFSPTAPLLPILCVGFISTITSLAPMVAYFRIYIFLSTMMHSLNISFAYGFSSHSRLFSHSFTSLSQ